jgi:hypothetical protein
MRNYLQEYNNLYNDILKEFDGIKDICFDYDTENLFDLPLTYSLDKYSVYREYAIIGIKDDKLIGMSVEDTEDRKVFYFDDLKLPSLIELLEYIKIEELYNKKLN